jgi:hypothetical protein
VRSRGAQPASRLNPQLRTCPCTAQTDALCQIRKWPAESAHRPHCAKSRPTARDASGENRSKVAAGAYSGIPAFRCTSAIQARPSGDIGKTVTVEMRRPSSSTEGRLCGQREIVLAMGLHCRFNGLAVPVPHQGAHRCTAGAGAVGGAGFTIP